MILAVGLFCVGCAPKRVFTVSVLELEKRTPVEGAKVAVGLPGIDPLRLIFRKRCPVVGITGPDGVVQLRHDVKGNEFFVMVDAPGHVHHRGYVRVGNLTPKGEAERAYELMGIVPSNEPRSLVTEVSVTTLK
ncbi:MAG: hypothetical protein NTW19_03585 [Planctomycetota bacterium]|nr:hypothetical protein [Planctomycetota bacterium]